MIDRLYLLCYLLSTEYVQAAVVSESPQNSLERPYFDDCGNYFSDDKLSNEVLVSELPQNSLKRSYFDGRGNYFSGDKLKNEVLFRESPRIVVDLGVSTKKQCDDALVRCFTNTVH